ncbi:hypothetical protein NDU88_004639 [Pleurodeles waltl]|uniref:Uncharacterized protein n=1 Tax=Pleurodeles waltl TaxID=8319 RepID=A0AAV7RIU5_PLEWA|nr:hypothetical protein NDU88_004639 [Pleurodeles waltl]
MLSERGTRDSHKPHLDLAGPLPSQYTQTLMLNDAPPGAFPDAYRLLLALLARDSPAVVVLLSERGTTSGSRGLSQAPPRTRGLRQARPLGPHHSGLTVPSLSVPASNHPARRLLRLLRCVYSTGF